MGSSTGKMLTYRTSKFLSVEEMSDRVIDVAGHLQKYAAPNSIAIAKQAIEPVHTREGFVTAGRVVDGYEVFIWPKDETAPPEA